MKGAITKCVVIKFRKLQARGVVQNRIWYHLYIHALLQSSSRVRDFLPHSTLTTPTRHNFLNHPYCSGSSKIVLRPARYNTTEHPTRNHGDYVGRTCRGQAKPHQRLDTPGMEDSKPTNRRLCFRLSPKVRFALGSRAYYNAVQCVGSGQETGSG
jgi:hypothetical protein